MRDLFKIKDDASWFPKIRQDNIYQEGRLKRKDATELWGM